MALERTILAGLTLVMVVLTFIAILRRIFSCVEIDQALFVRADKFIGLGITGEVVGAERVFAEVLEVTVVVGGLVKGVVLEIVPQLAIFFWTDSN